VLSTLQFGIVTVRVKGVEEYFTVSGGVVEVQPDQVTVLADAAENVNEIDETRANAARQRAQELLVKGGLPPDDDTYLSLQAALRRSDLRLEAVRRYRARQRLPGQ
jgi:F-type H+-transporting ATPase subunit epsilon